MENNEFNKEELLGRMRDAANAPAPTSTLDILNQIRGYARIHKESGVAADMMAEIKDSLPEQFHEDVEDKIDLLLQFKEKSGVVFKALCDMLPLAQRLDAACNLTKEQLNNIIKDIEGMEE